MRQLLHLVCLFFLLFLTFFFIFAHDFGAIRLLAAPEPILPYFNAQKNN